MPTASLDIRPLHGLNITPWNPQPALAVALLLWNRRYLGLVLIGLLAAELAVRGVPANWFVTLAAAAARRDLLWFTAIAVTGALFNGTVFVATHVVAGLGPARPDRRGHRSTSQRKSKRSSSFANGTRRRSPDEFGCGIFAAKRS